MFLKSVELFGFKSFADRTKFDFVEGITSLLGPNGSGKSNVVDSIKWVLGSQSLTAVRAGKRDDVIFNGTDTRKPMPMCEVILTLDNEQNILNIDASEVEIKRRMFRSGENEYYINRERALLRNVKELFMDTGVGKTAYSILEQGKIDQILSLKPEDRRYIFEEAAGISRFRQESEEAQRKLEKTDANMAQAEILFREEEKKFNSRKFQMERLAKSRELTARREEVEVSLQLSYVQSLTKFYDMKRTQIENDESKLKEIDRILESGRSEIDSFDREIENLRSQREEINTNLNRTDEQRISTLREIDFFRDRYHEIHERTKVAQLKAQQVQDRLDRDKAILNEKKAELAEIGNCMDRTVLTIRKSIDEIASLKKDASDFTNQINDLTLQIESFAEEKNNITQQLSRLAAEITDKLQQSINGSGYSTALRSKAEKKLIDEISKAKKILSDRLEFLKGTVKVDFDRNVYLKALEETDEDIKAEFDEIKGLFQEYSGTVPTFIDEFTASDGTLAKKAELDSGLEKIFRSEADNKQRIAECLQETERVNRRIILKESDLQELKVEQAQLSARSDSMKSQIIQMEENLRQSESEYSDAKYGIESEIERENEAIEKVDNAKNRLCELENQIEELRLSLQKINETIEDKNNEFKEKNSSFREEFNKKQELMTTLAADKANLENINDNIQKIYTDFFDKTGKSLREFNNHEITEKVEDLKAEAEELRVKIQNLGYINYMAEEEYNEAKKNYEFYKKNLDDLISSKRDLEEVIAEIKRKSEEMFMETYNSISVAFEEMFSILFGGGRASLSLTDPENLLQSGIEITAQPPGKKPSTLSLLSGGEKSMTAVALLFATYKVKPSPFCILDEIDAALDSKNIGSFMKVLETFGEKSQFIIITHNKGTVMGSSSLLGITQEELGVSKMIGIKLDEDSNGSSGTKLKN